MERKYTIEEIERMRNAIRWSYPSGVSYYAKERDADIENRLRTYMQNGTDPEELEAERNAALERNFARQEAEQVVYKEMVAKAPPPRVLKTKDDVIDEWFQTSVARYAGATAQASDLYDGYSGHTLKRFANNHAPDGVNITQRDMERYLDAKGIKSRNAMFAKRYDGVQVIIHGNVRSGNYGT